jgi:ankyrin repeat protein
MQNKKFSLFQKVFFGFITCTLIIGAIFIIIGDSDNNFINICMTGSLQQVNDAIENGANVNFLNMNRLTPLMAALQYNSIPEIIIALINAGADVNTTHIYGVTPLIMASVNNPNLEVITALIKAGADVNAKDETGATALMRAAKESNPEVISILLKSGAEAKLVDNKGKMAIDYMDEKEAVNNTEAFKILKEVSL